MGFRFWKMGFGKEKKTKMIYRYSIAIAEQVAEEGAGSPRSEVRIY